MAVYPALIARRLLLALLGIYANDVETVFRQFVAELWLNVDARFCRCGSAVGWVSGHDGQFGFRVISVDAGEVNLCLYIGRQHVDELDNDVAVLGLHHRLCHAQLHVVVASHFQCRWYVLASAVLSGQSLHLVAWCEGGDAFVVEVDEVGVPVCVSFFAEEWCIG